MEEEVKKNTKKECQKCHRILRIKHFVINKLTGELVCKRCDNKIGNNKWYVPKGNRTNEKIGRFNMTTEEKKLLVKQGKSWKQVNGDCKYMRGAKARKNKEFWKKKKESKLNESQQKEQMKKLVAGLK
jgi:hypothetical protein